MYSVEIDCLMLLDEIGCEPNEIDSIWADATLDEIELPELKINLTSEQL